MTKFNEILDPAERSSKNNYVDELWSSWREARSQTLQRITNYLFVLNTGALLASLTYVATKTANSCIHASIWLFAIGTILCAAHAASDYYITEAGFNSYKKDVDELYSNEIEWNEFVDRSAMRPTCDWAFHKYEHAPNKSLKAVRIRSLDSFSRRMLRILRAACRCPLARRYAFNPPRRDHGL